MTGERWLSEGLVVCAMLSHYDNDPTQELLATHKDLAEKLVALEKKYDKQFRIVFEAIRELMTPEDPPKQQQIGFRPEE